MEDAKKPWWRSKTIISNIVTALIGVYMSLGVGGVNLPEIPGWVITLLSGMGIYGRVVATREIKPVT